MIPLQIGSRHLAFNGVDGICRFAGNCPLQSPRLTARAGLGLLIVMAAFMSSATWAQAGVTTEPSRAQDDVEEIVVTGERRKFQLRLQMFEAEKAAYALFNEFNDEPRFDISCSVQIPTGSRIHSESQLCQPEFEIQAHRGHAQDMLEDFRLWFDGSNPNKISTATSQPPPAVIASQQKEYRAKLKQVAEEQPAFLEALIKYSQLKAEYEAAE